MPMLRLGSVLAAALTTVLASACSASWTSMRATPAPRDVASNPSRYIVVSIANEPSALQLEAGSSFRPYPPGEYTIASAASYAAKALERDYGLSEAAAWPIAALHVYCIVLRVPDAQAPESIIAQLGRDPRVKAVQHLNEFQTRSGSNVPPRGNGKRSILQTRGPPDGRR